MSDPLEGEFREGTHVEETFVEGGAATPDAVTEDDAGTAPEDATEGTADSTTVDDEAEGQ